MVSQKGVKCARSATKKLRSMEEPEYKSPRGILAASSRSL